MSDLWAMDVFDVEEEVLRHLDKISMVRWDRGDGAIRLHMMIARAFEARLAAVVGARARTHRTLIEAWGDP